MRYLPIAAAFTLAILPAQDVFKAKQFLPREYQNVVHVNFKALRDTGVWDEFQVGMIKVLTKELEREAGFRLSSLDRLTMVIESPERGQDGMAPRNHDVVILEGNTELDVPARIAGNTSYTDESIGIYDVKRRSNWGDEVFFLPRPDVQVFGSTKLLLPALQGRSTAGMPCADIMSLMSGRKGALVYIVVHAGNDVLNERMVKSLFPEVEWPEDDGLEFLMFRLDAVGDPDDPNVELQIVLRHGKSGEGLNVTEKAMTDLIERGAKEPQLRLVAPLLKKVEITRDRIDLSLRLDLGSGRMAAGNLTMFLLPMMTFGAVAPMPGQVVEIVEAVEAPPVPIPVKKKK